MLTLIGNQMTAPVTFSGQNSASELRMSSREIAELTGKRHDHVMADIRKMLAELGFQPPEFSGRYLDAKGEARACFNLPKRETLILVSGYSISLRARIIDRWQELEAQQSASPAIPQTLPEALRLAADMAEQKARAEAALVIEQEKVAVEKEKVAILEPVAAVTEQLFNRP